MIREKMSEDHADWGWDEKHSLPHLDLWYRDMTQARLFFRPERGGEPAYAAEQSALAFCAGLQLSDEQAQEFILDLLRNRGAE